MRRALPKQPDLQFTAPQSETALAIHRTPAEQRLEALQKERERLLRDIAKKKAACEVTEREARAAHSMFEARVRPVRDAYLLTLEQLRAIFTALLGSESRLNRRDKARVRRLYLQALPDLAASDANAGDFCDTDTPPFGSKRSGSAPEGESGYSAHKPSEKDASLLRRLFRKLAVALHPDRVQDPKERDSLTSIMKEVTRAYESGDVARLVELDRTWLAATPARAQGDDVAQRTAELVQANKELRRQLRALTAQLKELKESVPGASSAKLRGPRAGGARATPGEHVAREMERELAQLQALRDFAQRFLDDEISITEFLLGPPLGSDQEDPFDQVLAEMLEVMADSGDEWEPSRGGGRRARRRRGA